MKCDELKVYVHPIKKSIRGHTSIGLAYYSKSEVDLAIAELKQKLEDAGVRERKLKRALYKACANWANLEVFDRTIGIDDPNVEASRWALMRNKCLKKAAEYK